MIDWEGLKALEAKSTIGPWEVDHGGDRSLVYVSMPLANTPIADCWSNCLESDAELIAALRNAFPAILAQHEADQATIAALRQQQGESVGYVRKESIDDVKKWSGAKIFFSDEDDGRNTIPLFTSPPQQEGMVLVPVEPTEAMLKAGDAIDGTPDRLLQFIYKAMIAAKP